MNQISFVIEISSRALGNHKQTLSEKSASDSGYLRGSTPVPVSEKLSLKTNQAQRLKFCVQHMADKCNLHFKNPHLIRCICVDPLYFLRVVNILVELNFFHVKTTVTIFIYLFRSIFSIFRSIFAIIFDRFQQNIVNKTKMQSNDQELANRELKLMNIPLTH